MSLDNFQGFQRSHNVLQIQITQTDQNDILRKKKLKTSVSMMALLPLAACFPHHPPDEDPDFIEEPDNVFTARDDENRTLDGGDFTEDVTVIGRGGDDTITTGSGDDRVNGGAGADDIDAGAGNDTVVLYQDDNSALEDTMDGGDSLGLGEDTLEIHGNSDTIAYELDMGAVNATNFKFIDVKNDTAESLFIDVEDVAAIGHKDRDGTAGTIYIAGDSMDSIATTPTTWVFERVDFKDETGEIYYHFDAVGGDEELNIDINFGSFSGFPVPAATFTEGVSNVWMAINDDDSLFNMPDSTDILTVTGKNGDDIIVTGSGNDIIDSGDGTDHVEGGAGGDDMDGGLNNFDLLSYVHSDAGVTINLDTDSAAGGHADGDMISNFEGIQGSAYDDVLTGNALSNGLWGRDGDDEINGGDGNDYINGGKGADEIDGGLGDDIVVYHESSAAVTINLMTNVNTGGAAEGDDISNVEDIAGSRYSDNITGDGADNTFFGNSGDDIMDGGAGIDQLIGGDGNDTLRGGADFDELVGQDGDDILIYDDMDIFNGGEDIDTLLVEGSGVSLDLSSFLMIDMEIIDLTGTGANDLEMTTAEMLSTTDGVNQLIIDGNGDDIVTLTGGDWVSAGVDGTYDVYIGTGTGTARLLVDSDISTTII